jgi:hypothetical protein
LNRAVIIACSARKRRSEAELSALARYDGPAWRTLRANLTCLVEPPFALSAEHGLISAYQEIADYDRRLTPARVRELVDQVADQLVAAIRGGRFRGEIFAYGGALYRELLEAARDLAQCELDRAIPITFSSGGIGDQLGQLKAWLRRHA